MNNEEKILLGIFITIIIVFGTMFLIYHKVTYVKTFEFDNMNYEIKQEGDVTLYHTSFVTDKLNPNKLIQYNMWLRNDPRELINISYFGDFILYHTIVWQSDEDYVCNGDGVIGVANLNQFFNSIGAEVIRDENATCSTIRNYTLIKLVNGSETQIEQVGKSCYEIQINNCEVLKGTERFLIEGFSAIPEKFKI